MRAVSRVLVPVEVALQQGGTHSSSTCVAAGIQRSSLVVRTGSPISGPWPEFTTLRPCSRWGLPCPECHHPGGALLPHRFTLATLKRGTRGKARRRPPCALAEASTGGLFSVALSLGLPPLAVSQHHCPPEPGLYLSHRPKPVPAGTWPTSAETIIQRAYDPLKPGL